MGLTAIEQQALTAFRRGARPAEGLDVSKAGSWVAFCLRVVLEAGRRVRGWRAGSRKHEVLMKGDQTPATEIERGIEALLIDELRRFAPDASVAGEESGGEVRDRGTTVAVDPVDGTWALLNRVETCATTLTVIEDAVPILGVISNPITGEIGYASAERTARWIQLGIFGEGDRADSLPQESLSPDRVLVNIQPRRTAGLVLRALQEGWRSGRLATLRSAGGSPAFGMMDAAKGSFTYVNLWGDRPTAAYDLACGVLLVRGAGGEVVDLDGHPIDALRHQTAFVAGVDEAARAEVVALVGAMG